MFEIFSCNKSKAEEIDIEEKNSTKLLKPSGKSFLFLICFLPALMSYSQETDKSEIETKLLEEARSNIEKFRKGPAQMTVLNEQGEPISNVKIEVNQLTHDFLFGNLSEEVVVTTCPEQYREAVKYY